MTPSEIIEHVSGASGISVERIMSKSRSKSTSRARQIAMLLCRELLDLSYPELGEVFGRDYTTVLQGVKVARSKTDSWPWSGIVQDARRKIAPRLPSTGLVRKRWVPLNDDGGEGLGEW